ncbi:hypothetical protein PRIPAC_82749 [Pristionchus pacificus]|uniref:Ankyrin repeat-containing protein n=1 Tax=Pristionchus pacificus TaxID=54126 RepID=A0A2A6BWX9_PRIPA|nr:hypothetical protein PRIPAC_82749 [Pristionchus pacificus]|eukprot:PDM70273.1 Ankyrin repeat-containing protein [Pristionchus pacificus]
MFDVSVRSTCADTSLTSLNNCTRIIPTNKHPNTRAIESLTLLVNAINETNLRQRTTSQSPRAAPTLLYAEKHIFISFIHMMHTALTEEPGWGLTDSVGRSALHHAALAGRPRHIIHFLVSHGASPGLQDSSVRDLLVPL